MALKEKHSYATPAIVVLPIENVEASYFEWLMAETQTAPAGAT
jgi:uncharacterized protein involved in tolerance to divalent cations